MEKKVKEIQKGLYQKIEPVGTLTWQNSFWGSKYALETAYKELEMLE